MSSLLVVDGDDGIRSVLEHGLASEGFWVTVATGGEQALGVLKGTPVDCILLDARLPELDGLEVCRRLRGAGDETPNILLTAYDAVRERVTGLEAGADDCVVKPFAFEELWPGCVPCSAGAGSRTAARSCVSRTSSSTAARSRSAGPAAAST